MKVYIAFLLQKSDTIIFQVTKLRKGETLFQLDRKLLTNNVRYIVN